MFGARVALADCSFGANVNTPDESIRHRRGAEVGLIIQFDPIWSRRRGGRRRRRRSRRLARATTTPRDLIEFEWPDRRRRPQLGRPK